jgi:amidohydrolase
MIDGGALVGVDRIFGLHVWPELPTGTIATRGGTIMAGADAFTIVIEGKGGHAANPVGSVDATAVAADIYNALHKLVTRETGLEEPAVLSIPMLKGSESFNIIPSSVELAGTLRTTDRRVRDRLWKRIAEVVEGYAKAWRCTGQLRSDAMYYPPTVNHDDAVAYSRSVVPAIQETAPSMVSEDFAFYLEEVSGAFFFLGIADESRSQAFPLHHPRFSLDEDALASGVALHAALALGGSQ